MNRFGFLPFIAVLAIAAVFVAPVHAQAPGGDVASATASEPDLFFIATYTARCQLIVQLDEAKKRQQDYLVRINDPQTQKPLRESLTQAVAILGSQIASYTTALEQLEAARAKDELFAFRPSVEWCRDFSIQSSVQSSEPATDEGTDHMFSQPPWGRVVVGRQAKKH